MRVRFLYSDRTYWEGPPQDAHRSPDPRPPAGGVIIMYGITNDGVKRTLRFRYDDVYYLYVTPQGWMLGSGTTKRDFLFKDESGCNGIEQPLCLPAGAVVRYGVTVSNEEAEAFGLLTRNDRYLLRPKETPLVRCG